MAAVCFQGFAADFAVKIIFWVLTLSKTVVWLMLQHSPEIYSVVLKTEAASFSEM
jgi:hypothetical protein